MADNSCDSVHANRSDSNRSVEEARVTSSTVESDKERLYGAVPPAKLSEDTATPPVVNAVEQNNPQGSVIRKAISGWGPYKRWRRYCKAIEMEKEDPAFWRKHDPEENVQGRLPDNERVQVPVIWVAELYTPSTVAGLFDGISDLGWEYGRTRNDNLVKWMSDVRHGRRAGWTNLGLVSETSSASFMSERVAPLPKDIRYCLPVLMSLTPSVTALVIAFVTTDESANQLDEPLRANYSTLTRRDPLFRRLDIVRYVLKNGQVRLGHRIHGPDNLRRGAVRSKVVTMQQECVNWVRKYLPGMFASMRTVAFPTALLFVTEEIRPLTEEASKITAFRSLSIDREYDAWESSEWPGGRLVLPRSWDDEGAQLVFACRRCDAFSDNAGYADPTSNGTIAHRADDLVRGLLSRWAVVHMLNSFHMRLASLRDKTARERRHRPIRDLREFRSLARTALYDILASAQEVLDFIENDHAYRWEVMEMKYVRSLRDTQPELIEALRTSLRNRAQQIQRESELLRSILAVVTDVSQTIANIRIQRLVVFLTVLSLGLALWSVFAR